MTIVANEVVNVWFGVDGLDGGGVGVLPGDSGGGALEKIASEVEED